MKTAGIMAMAGIWCQWLTASMKEVDVSRGNPFSADAMD